MVVFWLVKADKSAKASSLKIFAEILGPPFDLISYVHGYCSGLSQGGTKFRISVDEDTLKAVQIPEDLEAELDKEIERFKREPRERESIVEPFKEALKKIDAYFENK